MKITLTIQSDQANKTLEEFLTTDLLIPRKTRHFLRMRKETERNGNPIQFHETLAAEDQLTLFFHEEDSLKPQLALGNAAAIQPLYEDEHLIVVNKPVGQKTHPNEPHETATLANDLAAYLAPSHTLPYVVHRLDQATSGCIVFAKNPIVLPILGQMLEQRQINRTYIADIEGSLRPEKQTINQKISRDRHDSRKQVIDPQKGKVAITHLETLHVFPDKTSRVACQLETGRTHQIRVHLASSGHPILGDPLYHPKPEAHQAERLRLHALSLHFTHPFTHVPIAVTTPLPWDQ